MPIQLINPNNYKQEDPLDKLAKALSIAQGITGIKASLDTIDAHKAEQESKRVATEMARQGFINPEKLAEYGKDYNTSNEASPNAIHLKQGTLEAPTDIYLSPRSKADDKNGPLSPSALNDFVKAGGIVVAPGTKGSITQMAIGPEGKPVPMGFMSPKKTDAKEDKPTADQFKAALFGKRVQQAEDVFGTLEKQNYNRADVKQGGLNLLPNTAQPKQLQQQNQAERNFVNSVLRRESGAAISPSEFSSAELQYFPRAGDAPETLAQKKANRLQAYEGLKAESGGAWQKTPYISTASVAKKGSTTNTGLMPTANAGGGGMPVKEINGIRYKKVKGGWEQVD